MRPRAGRRPCGALQSRSGSRAPPPPSPALRQPACHGGRAGGGVRARLRSRTAAILAVRGPRADGRGGGGRNEACAGRPRGRGALEVYCAQGAAQDLAGRHARRQNRGARIPPWRGEQGRAAGGRAVLPDYPRFPATDRTIRAVLFRSASATPGWTGSESTAWAALCVAESGRAGRRAAVS